MLKKPKLKLICNFEISKYRRFRYVDEFECMGHYEKANNKFKIHAEKRWFRWILRHHSTSCNWLEIPEDASAFLSGFEIDQTKPKMFNLKQ